MVRSTNAANPTVAGQDRPFAADVNGAGTVSVWKGNSVIANIAKAI